MTASTSARLSDVVAALNEQPYGRPLGNPWGAAWAPQSAHALVHEQWPLSGGFVLHLSGGGSVLWVAAHHCLADFESLQTLAAHWAQAYNAELRASGRPAPPLAAPGIRTADPSGLSQGDVPRGTAGHSAPLDYVRALPEERRNPRMNAADVEALAQPPPGQCGELSLAEVPPRREVEPLTWWKLRLLQAYASYHVLWRGGGFETRVCRVSAQRLAELKAQATRELQAAKSANDLAARPEQPTTACAGRKVPSALSAARSEGGRGGPAGQQPGGSGPAAPPGVDWISTNDALTGRLMQVLHGLPVRRPHAMACFMVANMRRRMQPLLPSSHVGNVMYSAMLEGARPSETNLGVLAAMLRRELNCHLVPQFRGCLARSSHVARPVRPRGLVFAACLEPRPEANLLAPEGPLNTARWDIEYDLWQFGPTPPVALLPEHVPGAVIIYPAAPSASGDSPGLVLSASMHRSSWRQLDGAGVDLVSAI